MPLLKHWEAVWAVYVAVQPLSQILYRFFKEAQLEVLKCFEMFMQVCAVCVGVLQGNEILGESVAKFCRISELVNTLPSQAK